MRSEMPRPARGFTLLELIVVMAIVSILAVVALPAYSDYATRAKIAEGIGMIGAMKSGIIERYYADGVFPDNNTDAGLDLPMDYRTEHVEQIAVIAGGIIQVTYAIPALRGNNVLQLVPCAQGGSVQWVCNSPGESGLESALLPSSCRQDINASSCPIALAAAASNDGMDTGDGSLDAGDRGSDGGNVNGNRNGNANGNGIGNRSARND
jgi:type IV pilus assembly protein PilA